MYINNGVVTRGGMEEELPGLETGLFFAVGGDFGVV